MIASAIIPCSLRWPSVSEVARGCDILEMYCGSISLPSRLLRSTFPRGKAFFDVERTYETLHILPGDNRSALRGGVLSALRPVGTAFPRWSAAARGIIAFYKVTGILRPFPAVIPIIRRVFTLCLPLASRWSLYEGLSSGQLRQIRPNVTIWCAGPRSGHRPSHSLWDRIYGACDYLAAPRMSSPLSPRTGDDEPPRRLTPCLRSW